MKVVVVGGGFGGLKTAIELAKLGGFEITLISERDHFIHHGLLYNTATGRDPKESVILIDEMISRYPAIKFYKDKINKVDATKQTLSGQKKTYDYDQLVLSPGLSEHFYGTNGAKKHSYTMNSVEGVQAFSAAIHEKIVEDKGLVCAIVGGGATGVELAGALAEYADRVARAHSISRPKAKFMIFEKSQRILPELSKSASQKVATQLKKLGVELRLNQSIERVSTSYIVSDGERVGVDTVVWTCGGMLGSLLIDHPGIFSVSSGGRVLVNQYLSAYPNIYVIGDSADTPLSGSATMAIRHARFIARHLKRQMTNLPARPINFGARPLISLPISRFWAYSERHGIYVSGRLGSFIRRLSELNSYTHFLSLEKSYHLWRRHRNSSELCHLCQRNTKMM